MPRPILRLHFCYSPHNAQPKILAVMVALLKKVVGPLGRFKLGTFPMLLNEEVGSAVNIAFNYCQILKYPNMSCGYIRSPQGERYCTRRLH